MGEKFSFKFQPNSITPVTLYFFFLSWNRQGDWFYPYDQNFGDLQTWEVFESSLCRTLGSPWKGKIPECKCFVWNDSINSYVTGAVLNVLETMNGFIMGLVLFLAYVVLLLILLCLLCWCLKFRECFCSA